MLGFSRRLQISGSLQQKAFPRFSVAGLEPGDKREAIYVATRRSPPKCCFRRKSAQKSPQSHTLFCLFEPAGRQEGNEKLLLLHKQGPLKLLLVLSVCP